MWRYLLLTEPMQISYSLFAKKEMRNIYVKNDGYYLPFFVRVSYLLFFPDAWISDRNLAQVPGRVAQVAAAEPRVFTGVAFVP